jgi:tetratricopeptide (TPR) repeat protein
MQTRYLPLRPGREKMAEMRINIKKGLGDIIFSLVLLLIVFIGMLLYLGCATTSEEKNVTEFNKQGFDYAKQGQYDQAISDFSKALEINPRNTEAYYNRGIAYYNQGRYDQAVSDFNMVLEISAGNEKAYYNRGISYYKQGQYDKAISDFNKALKIEPGYEKASNMRRLAYVEDQYEKELSELNEQIAKLKKENRRILEENQNKTAMMRDQNALLNQQIDSLRQENKRTRDENKVLAEKRTKLQRKNQALSSKSYGLKTQDNKINLMYVQQRSVRVRSGPGMSYRSIGGLKLGEKIFTKDVKGDWCHIVDRKNSGRTIGWVHRSLLGKMPPGQ